MPSKSLKQLALNQLRGKWGIAILIIVVGGILTSIISSIPTQITRLLYTLAGLPMSITDVLIGESSGAVDEAILYSFSFADVSVALFVVGTVMLFVAYFISYCAAGIFDFGICGAMLKNARTGYMELNDVFAGFKYFVKCGAMYFLMALFQFLWSILFIIPGIIAAYRYRLALYLLLDHPEMSAMDCIRESKRIMSGNKGQLFVLDLSFIGWWILAGIPIVGLFVRVWVVPYTQMTYALYYTTLTGTNAPGAIPGDGSAQDEPHEEHPWEN